MDGDVHVRDVVSGNGRELPITAETVLDELQQRRLADARVTGKDCQVTGKLVAHRAAGGVESYRLDAERNCHVMTSLCGRSMRSARRA